MSTSAEGLSLVIIAHEDIYTSIARQRKGLGAAYQERAATVVLSPAALGQLGLRDGDLIQLTGAAGTVVVKGTSDSAVEEGIGLMPISPYSNFLAGDDAVQGCMLNLRHIRVTARGAEGDVTPLSDLLVGWAHG